MKSNFKIFSVLLVVTVLVFWVPAVRATTPTTPTIDGTIDTSTEWATDELFGASGGSVSRSMYITWDATNLYIGITNLPSHVTIYFDTVSGGETSAIGPGTYPIATSPAGYNFAWRLTNATASWFQAGGWTSPTTPSPGQLGRSGDLELSVPLSQFSISTGDTIRILAVAGTAHTNAGINSYWPNVSGNQLTPSVSFSQAIVLENVGLDDQSPGNAPTAVSLQTTDIANSTPLALVAALAGLLGVTAVAVTRRRTR